MIGKNNKDAHEIRKSVSKKVVRARHNRIQLHTITPKLKELQTIISYIIIGKDVSKKVPAVLIASRSASIIMSTHLKDTDVSVRSEV